MALRADLGNQHFAGAIAPPPDMTRAMAHPALGGHDSPLGP
ncbi:hypothetical protein STRTUCAR8_00212 [Streptomyces turgidiscabies Car8]|uniref:Uncharacterized protein n=1 Tax=Streptomyces turgidiscabies (strain Car8) TaxID=698760 RepID=L7EUW2_STRT8|nr:hypothetical protein STRTUCAR8_00212 [Streptomyces turgidiscabies Car8]